MFEAPFRNLDATLRRDAGCSSELDYIEQTSWVLFLKYLDDIEEFVENQLLPYLKSFHVTDKHVRAIDNQIRREKCSVET